MPSVNKEIKQLCKRCKGTGTTSDVAKTQDGRVIVRNLYTKGEGDKPLYQDCPECGGEGMTLQPLPTKIFQDGTEVKLTKDEAFQHFNPNVALPERKGVPVNG